MRKHPLFRHLASLVQARINCEQSNNTEWFAKYSGAIQELVSEHMPRGSGFDSGTSWDSAASTGEKLVFYTAFHHMNDNGFYDGWTEHKVTAVPSFYDALTTEIER